MRKANIVSGIIGMAFSAGAFIQTLSFRQFKNVPIGPEFFPRYVAAGLFVCSMILAFQSLKSNPGKGKPSPSISPLNKGMRRLFIGIAIIVAYALCWEPVGFLISTPFAMFAIMFLIGFRKYTVMAVFSAAVPLIVFGAFRFFLNVEMPLGLIRFLFY